MSGLLLQSPSSPRFSTFEDFGGPVPSLPLDFFIPFPKFAIIQLGGARYIKLPMHPPHCQIANAATHCDLVHTRLHP